MDHENQSGNGGWLGSRRSLVLDTRGSLSFTKGEVTTSAQWGVGLNFKGTRKNTPNVPRWIRE